VSHDSSEIILISWFDAKETFIIIIIIIKIENSSAYFFFYLDIPDDSNIKQNILHSITKSPLNQALGQRTKVKQCPNDI